MQDMPLRPEVLPVRWELSQEQVDFAEAFRGWLDQVAPTAAAREGDPAGAATDFQHRLAAEGWLGVGFPEEIGGQGGGLVELALVAEELGRAAAPAGGWLSIVLALPALPAEAARRALQGDSGTVLAVPADAVPGSTPPAAAQGAAAGVAGNTAPAVRGGAASVAVQGRMPMVLGANGAASFVVPAMLGPDLVLVLVDAADNGVVVQPRGLLDWSREVADVHLERAAGVVLDAEATSSVEQAALRAAVLVAADALGACERMLDLTVAYSLQRQQFGKPIGAFQAVKHMAAGMLVDVEAARSIVYLAAASVQAGHEAAAVRAATAKAQVTASASRVADDALTLHGAIGYTWEHDLQLLYKRAKLNEQLLGTPQAWNERIADALLGT